MLNNPRQKFFEETGLSAEENKEDYREWLVATLRATNQNDCIQKVMQEDILPKFSENE